MFRFNSSKLFIIALVVMIFATAAYAFAASNTFAAGMSNNAGEGQTAIGGYTVSGVTYTYSTANPSQISTVSFTIAPSAKKASVSLTTGGTLQACTDNGGGTSWTCTITGVSVQAADMLRVVASD